MKNLTDHLELHEAFKYIANIRGIHQDRLKEELLTTRLDFNLPLKASVDPSPVKWIPGRTVERNSIQECNSNVMIIGDKPSYNDLYSKKDPFLDVVLGYLKTEYDIDSTEWYYTNLIKMFYTIKFPRIPAFQWKLCESIFLKEYDILKPEFIVVLGAQACGFLLGEKFSNCVGSSDVYFEAGGHTSKAFVVQNPAKLYKSPELKDSILMSSDVFAKAYKGIEDVSEAKYEYVDTLDRLSDIVDSLIETGKDNFDVDFEWAGEEIRRGVKLRSLQIGTGPGEAYYISFSKPLDPVKGFYCGFCGEPSFGEIGLCLNEACESNNTDLYPYHLVDVIKEADAKPLLKKLFDRKHIKLNAHHSRVELEVFKVNFDLDLTQQFINGLDTMLAYHSLYPGLDNCGLEVVTERYTTLGRYERDLVQWLADNDPKFDKNGNGYARVPEDILFLYGCRDVDVLSQAVPQLIEELSNHKLFNPYNLPRNRRVETLYDRYKFITRYSIPALLKIESQGVMLDIDRVKKVTEYVNNSFDDMLEEFRALINWPAFNPGSTQHRMYLLFGMRVGKQEYPSDAFSFNMEPVTTTEKPARQWNRVKESEKKIVSPATNTPTIKLFAHRFKEDDKKKELDLVEKFRDINSLSTMISSFIPRPDSEGVYPGGLLKSVEPDGRLRSHFLFTTATSRFRSYNFNLLNIPNNKEHEYSNIFVSKDKPDDWFKIPLLEQKKLGIMPENYFPLRTCISASPGNILIEADWKQAELHVTARVAKDKLMIEVLTNPDRDFHSEMAIRAFNLDYNGPLSGTKEFVEKNYPHLRIIAKAVIFGILYGRGAASIALSLEGEGNQCTIEEAQKLIDTIMSTFTGLKNYFDGTKKCMARYGYVENMYGGIRRFYETKDGSVMASNEREAINTRIQSTVSDALIIATHTATFLIDQMHLDSRVVIPFHDAMYFDTPLREKDIIINKVIPISMIDATAIEDKGLVLPYDITITKRWKEKIEWEDLEKLVIEEAA